MEKLKCDPTKAETDLPTYKEKLNKIYEEKPSLHRISDLHKDNIVYDAENNVKAIDYGG